MDISELSELSPGEIAIRFPQMKKEFKKLNLPFSLMNCSDANSKKELNELLTKFFKCIDQDKVEGPKETNCTEMVRYILAKFHKRERDYISETTKVIAELEEDLKEHPKFKDLKVRWAKFADHHLAHFREEEQYVFADLLKVDIYEKPDINVKPMQFGCLTRPFMDLEKDHESAIDELGTLTEEFLDLTHLDRRFSLVWLNTKRLYLSVLDHIHYENFVLYPAALNLEAALCY